MYKFAKKVANHEGFTLVELIVVIAILGILAGIAIPVYSGYINKANQAADNVLLSAVNTAFAAACVEAEPGRSGLPDTASATIGSDGKLTSITPYGAAETDPFWTYFGDNKNTAFKVYTTLQYDKEKGFYGDGSGSGSAWTSTSNGDGTTTYTNGTISLTISDEDVENVKNSTFGTQMHPDELMGNVGTVVGAASTVVNDPSTMEAILNNIMGSGYASSIGINSTDEDYAKKLSNALVMGVANQVVSDITTNGMEKMLNSLTSDETMTFYSNLTGDALKNMVMTSNNGLSNLCLMYGMMAGFANSETAKDATVMIDGVPTNIKTYFNNASADLGTSSGGTEGLQKIVAIANTLTKTDEFDTYMDDEATKDFTGLVSAMNAVQSNDDSFISAGVLESGFVNSDIAGILNMLLGG